MNLTPEQVRLLTFLRDNTSRPDWTEAEVARASGLPVGRLRVLIPPLVKGGQLDPLEPRLCRVLGLDAPAFKLRDPGIALPVGPAGEPAW